MSEIATTLVATLAARGVTLRVHGKKLAMSPKRAYGEMSAAERRTLKQHKAAIIAVVLDGHYAPTVATTTTAAAVQPAPAKCKWCNRSPCIGDQHEAFYALHPEAAQKREAEARNREFRLVFGLDPSPLMRRPSNY